MWLIRGVPLLMTTRPSTGGFPFSTPSLLGPVRRVGCGVSTLFCIHAAVTEMEMTAAEGLLIKSNTVTDPTTDVTDAVLK